MENTKELYKFQNNPKYRKKVINKIHKEQDNEYNKKISQLKVERDKLMRTRIQEINRIANSRWTMVANGRLMINYTEGKIRINQNEALFSSIHGAQINIQTGYKVVTKEKATSKKHTSLGGAALGGLVLGPVGAVVGGVGLGKTKTKGTSVSDQIPICNHMGVVVNIDGFCSEIVLISTPVVQIDKLFINAQNQAQNIILQLRTLAKTSVPQSFLRPEEENSVIHIDNQIRQKQKELQIAIADKPTYSIPSKYRSAENQLMSDKEYLEYLAAKDRERQSTMEVDKERVYQQKKQYNEKVRQQRIDHMKSFDYIGLAKKVGHLTVEILFWGFSLINLLLFIVQITMQGGGVSGSIFLITALLINPLIFDLINKKLFKIPRWVCVIILIVGFFVGVLTSPVSDDTNTSEVSIYLIEMKI